MNMQRVSLDANIQFDVPTTLSRSNIDDEIRSIVEAAIPQIILSLRDSATTTHRLENKNIKRIVVVPEFDITTSGSIIPNLQNTSSKDAA